MENKIIVLTDVLLGDPEFHRDLFYTGMTRAVESVRILCDKRSRDRLLEWAREGGFHA
jgi:ATP-dependent exoDNAse (exonuclease V) alpha subunit